MLSDVDGMGEIPSVAVPGCWVHGQILSGKHLQFFGDEEVGKTLRAQASYTDGYEN